jgi:hypothetical protein
MRRIAFALLLLLVPVAAEAQPRLMVGGGFTAPNGDVSAAADPGYHLRVALDIAIPTIPVGLRGDGAFHKLGAGSATLVDTNVLEGAVSLVYRLPGVGLQPYVLGGFGRHRTESGPVSEPVVVAETGLHAGFGVAVGGLGLGAFAELRFIRFTEGVTPNMVPLTLGLRF